MHHWKKISSARILDSPWVQVDKDVVDPGNGNIISDFYLVHISDAVAIVAETSDHHVVLKKEYRYCYQDVFTEIPAGCIERDEDPLCAAKRELLEETGYTSDDWIYLGKFAESSSKLTNWMHLYWAKDCKKTAEQHLDENEEIEVALMSFEDALDFTMEGGMLSHSASHALLKVARLKEKE
jgi:8-oxo-dGTP pyrophosphatase MutT (NUDIX family)